MFDNYTDEELLEEMYRLSQYEDPFDNLLNEMKNLLDDDAAILSEEEELVAKKELKTDGIKKGASEMAPAGHQWVYVFIVNSKLPTSKVIKHFTKQPYNHASLSFDKSLTNMATFSGSTFKRENVHKFKPEATFSLYKIAVPNHIVTVMKDSVNNIEKCKDDYKYSFKGLLGFVFKRHQDKLNNRENAMFCSQFLARMFATAGMPIFSKPDYTIRPYDFAKNKNFKFCYKGMVKNFDPSKIR